MKEEGPVSLEKAEKLLIDAGVDKIDGLKVDSKLGRRLLKMTLDSSEVFAQDDTERYHLTPAAQDSYDFEDHEI
jgi:hypothetical protein